MGCVHTTSVADKASLSDLRRSLRHDLAAAGVADPVTFDCLVAVGELWSRAGGGISGQPGPSVTWDISPTELRFQVRSSHTIDGCKASHPSRTGGSIICLTKPL